MELHRAEAPQRPPAIISLHWFTLVALTLAVAVIWAREGVDGRAARLWMLDVHRHLGVLALLLLIARLCVRLRVGRLPR
ncbi:MAG: hypothetical protein ABI433_13200 [Burkholderiaceae bacterium]